MCVMIWRRQTLVPSCRLPPNQGLQRTALYAHKIGLFLKSEFGSKAFPIYECAAAEAQAVSPLIIL